MFYLLWLSAVEADVFEPDEPEPMPGIGPMTGALEALAEFFDIDRYLVAAAAERGSDPLAEKPASSKAVKSIIAAMTDPEKTSFLTRLFDGDAHVGNELRALVRHRLTPPTDTPAVPVRTVGDLRARAKAIRQARERAMARRPSPWACACASSVMSDSVRIMQGRPEGSRGGGTLWYSPVHPEILSFEGALIRRADGAFRA